MPAGVPHPTQSHFLQREFLGRPMFIGTLELHAKKQERPARGGNSQGGGVPYWQGLPLQVLSQVLCLDSAGLVGLVLERWQETGSGS